MTRDTYAPSNGAELVRRLPEVSMVHGTLRNEIVDAFVSDVPDYVWLARASANHHPPDERGLGGLWIHIKRVFTAYTMLEPTFRELGAIDSFEANCARAAVLLHDAFKYGRYPRRIEQETVDGHDYADDRLAHVPEYTQPNHDVQMAAYVREETDMPDEVARAVESHGGSTSWGSHEGPSPSDDLELLVHLADLVASNHRHRLPVFKPARELTVMVESELETIDDSGWVEEVNEYV